MSESSTYQTIFNHRGGRYQDGMVRWPQARRREFLHMLDAARIAPGMTVCDVPAGGGYLRDYLPADIHYLALEPSRPFASACAGRGQTVLGEFSSLPLAAGSVDRMVCLAALHHIQDPSGFFAEAQRCLRADGVLALADVPEGSAVALFLNDFVDTHTPAGHAGRFLSQGTHGQLRDAGFVIDKATRLTFPWVFPDRAAMATFCAQIFGLEASGEVVLGGIDRYLSPAVANGSASLTWELMFLTAIRQDISGSRPVGRRAVVPCA